MKNWNFRRFLPLLPVASLAILAGCNIVQPAQEDPTRYFVLSDSSVQTATSPAAGAVRIGLRTVKVESYLKKREMVVRTGDNEVEFRDYQRWAEPLDAAISRVLRQRLLGSPAVASAAAEPFPVDQDRDFDVSVDIRRFEGSVPAGGRATANLSAMIEIWTAGDTPRLVARKLFTAPEAAWDGRDYGLLARLLSEDAAALGQEILAEIPAKN
ncbi:MAG TPA: PqiC family protein [Opitutaceae bacterium]